MTRNEAQRRNWLKYRILGTTNTPFITQGLLTFHEIDLINKINKIKKELIENWDENTKQFITNKQSSIYKKYKCYCGKRTNVDRKINGEQVCKKHFDLYKEHGKSNR